MPYQFKEEKLERTQKEHARGSQPNHIVKSRLAMASLLTTWLSHLNIQPQACSL